MKRWHQLALAFLAGTALFLIRFDPEIVLPGNNEWLLAYEDGAQFFLGWSFFRDSPWSFPLGHVAGYLETGGTYVALTDSIPLVAVPLRLVADLLPNPFQYFGFWMLITYGLQGLFAWLLVRSTVRDPVLRIAGFTFLLAFPPFLHRAGHVALSSHWILLAGLWLGVRTSKAGLQVAFGWVLLTAVSALVHPYLTAMLLATAAALHFDACRSGQVTRRELAGVLALLVTQTLGLWFSFGYLSEGSGTVSGFGTYSMNLNAFYNADDTSSLLKPLPLLQPGQHDGYAYLGVGGLALAGCVLGVPGSLARIRWFLPRHRGSVLVSIGLILFAVSNRVAWNGRLLFEYDLPWGASFLASVFRSGGRFHWPVSYGLLLGAIVLADRCNVREVAKRLGVATLLILQLVDTWPLLSRGSGAKHPPLCQPIETQRFVSRLQSSWWDEAAGGTRRIVTLPPLQYSTQFWGDFRDFAVLARNHGASTTAGSASRISIKRQVDARERMRADLELGQVDLRDLYVVRSTELASSWPALDASCHCARVDGFFVCLPNKSPIAIEGVPVRGGVRFDEFLEEYAGGPDLLVLVVKDEATASLSPEARSSLRAWGSAIDELQYRGSYAGLFVRGTTVWERIDNSGAIVEEFPAGTTLGELELTRPMTVRSAGYAVGNQSSIHFDKEYDGDRGFLCLVISPTGQVVVEGYFDTHLGNKGYLLELPRGASQVGERLAD